MTTAIEAIDMTIELTGLSPEEVEELRAALPAAARITLARTDPQLRAAIARFPEAWDHYVQATSPSYYFHRSAIMSNWGRSVPREVHDLFRDAIGGPKGRRRKGEG